MQDLHELDAAATGGGEGMTKIDELGSSGAIDGEEGQLYAAEGEFVSIHDVDGVLDPCDGVVDCFLLCGLFGLFGLVFGKALDVW